MNRSLQSWTVGLAWLLLCVSCEPGDHGRDALDVQDAHDATDAEASSPEPELAAEPVDVATEEPCERRCRDRECGPDGCGGLCGTCEPYETCDAGACGRVCETDAACTDRQACAPWPDRELGRCVEVCVGECPAGLGLQAFDGCHCRVQPIRSPRTPEDPCADPAVGFDGYLHVVDQGNGTTLDLRSGLLWTHEPVTTSGSTATATDLCEAYGLGGLSWRLPTIDEVVGVRDVPPWVCHWNGSASTCLEIYDRVVVTAAPWTSTPCVVAFPPYPTSWPSLRMSCLDSTYVLPVFCVHDDSAPPLAPLERFVSLLDGALADRVTGLAWTLPFGASPAPEPATPGAACEDQAGGWRTPTFREVATLWHPATPGGEVPEALERLGLTAPLLPLAAGHGAPVADDRFVDAPCDQARRILVSIALSPNAGDLLRVGTTLPGSTAVALCVRSLADGDGVATAIDVCPGIPDPDQADADGDGLGAPCDPDERSAPPSGDPCQPGACGVVPWGGQAGWLCRTCLAPQVCVDGACVAVTCADDAECQADADTLPGGTVRRCNPATHACELGIDDHAEVLDLLQRIYRGAAVYYSRGDRLTLKADPVPCQFPANQGVTPIEGTCCPMQGGPDADGDDLCDADPTCWNDTNGVWASLGLHMLDAHAFAYSFSSHGTLQTARFTASAFGDQDCDAVQSTFQVLSYLPDPEDPPCRLPLPLGLTFQPESLDELQVVSLTPAQRDGFFPPAGTVSLHPFYDEVAANLAALLDGAVAFYEAQPADACTFPASTWPTPIEGVCCWSQGGPDADHDDLCDPDPVPWEGQSWPQVGFSLQGTHAFVYQATWDPAAALYRASAYSDLDCDTLQSTFVRFARPVAGSDGCDAEVVPGMYIENETE